MAVQIVEICSNRLCIDTNVFEGILDIVGDRPVAIVSVNGPMRSGKSYIINHFLRYLTVAPEEDWFHRVLPVEFHWKNSSERQTTGLMMWPKPLMVNRDGQEMAILLVDTQGCFDDKTSMAENCLLFAFSCLISSVLVFNFKNQISEDVLQFLQLFVGHAKAIADQEDRNSLSRLILLIRDWQFPMDYPFGIYDDTHSPNGGANFKNEKLDVGPKMAPESRTVRQELASSFRDITCCLMPYPGNELAHHDKSDNLDPQFVQAIRELVPQIFAPGPTMAKRIGNIMATGNELKLLLQKWAEIFAGADIPAVQNVAEATAEVQNAAASSVALKHYQGEMTEVVQSRNGLPDDELRRIHDSKKEEAVVMYQQAKRIKHQGIQQRFSDVLKENIERSFGQFQEVNAAKWNLRDAQESAAKEAAEREAAAREAAEREAAAREAAEREAAAREAAAHEVTALEVAAQVLREQQELFVQGVQEAAEDIARSVDILSNEIRNWFRF